MRTFCLWWHFHYLTRGRNYRKIISSHSFFVQFFRQTRIARSLQDGAIREAQTPSSTPRVWGAFLQADWQVRDTHKHKQHTPHNQTTWLSSFILSFNKLGTFGFQQCLVKNKEKNIHKRKSIVMVRPCNAHPLNVNTAQRAQERDEEIEVFFCSELYTSFLLYMLVLQSKYSKFLITIHTVQSYLSKAT